MLLVSNRIENTRARHNCKQRQNGSKQNSGGGTHEPTTEYQTDSAVPWALRILSKIRHEFLAYSRTHVPNATERRGMALVSRLSRHLRETKTKISRIPNPTTSRCPTRFLLVYG